MNNIDLNLWSVWQNPVPCARFHFTLTFFNTKSLVSCVVVTLIEFSECFHFFGMFPMLFPGEMAFPLWRKCAGCQAYLAHTLLFPFGFFSHFLDFFYDLGSFYLIFGVRKIFHKSHWHIIRCMFTRCVWCCIRSSHFVLDGYTWFWETYICKPPERRTSDAGGEGKVSWL